jgi:hypothetical protein
MPRSGFEAFVDQVHSVIEAAGRETIYVFDCLSHLADVWLSDRMLGNFFRLTCPRLLDLDTVTYFGVFRNRHARRRWRDHRHHAVPDRRFRLPRESSTCDRSRCSIARRRRWT